MKTKFRFTSFWMCILLFVSIFLAAGPLPVPAQIPIYPRIEEEDGDPAGVLVKGIFPAGSLTKTGTTWNVSLSQGLPDSINLNSGLRNWRAAIAKLKTDPNAGIFNICCVGDSLTEGGHAGSSAADYRTNGFIGRFRTRLATLYGDVGLGFIPSHFSNDYAYFTYTGSWGTYANYGVGNTHHRSSTEGDTIEFSFVGTGVGVVVSRMSVAAQFTVVVDSNGPATFDSYNATYLSPYAYECTGFADANHTCTITVDNAANPSRSVYFLGMYPIKGTSGFRVNDCARYGATTAWMVCDNCVDAEIDFWTPTLTIIALVANDYYGQQSLTTYESYIEILIDAALSHGDCLVLSNGIYGVTKTIPQTSYEAVCKSLAIEKGCAYLNLNQRWGSYDIANADGFMSDTVHNTAAGHQDAAMFLMEYLLEER